MKKQTSAPNSETKDGKPFLIVAIGASAGGITAVTELLKNLPADTGMAYVYIQHLDPTHESSLVVILSKCTKMKVLEAKNLMTIEPDHVYVIPPNKDMSIIDGVLKLNARKVKPSLHLPIDQFFVSLAQRHKEAAIGVILSGNGHDGTLGLRAIKTAGGITFAQDDSALFKSMPTSAVADGVVDLVLSPKDIALELARISKQSNMAELTASEKTEENYGDTTEELKSIIQLLKKSTGVDFTHYKISTVKRRILRRMVLYKLEKLKDYVQYLKQHTNEINVLYQDLLINVTNFFRDPDAMEYLKKRLFPAILKNKAPRDPVRIWVPACATGEEAYSIAMILMEVLGDKVANTAVQIFATDLSKLAISKARLGVYSRNDLAEISPRRLQRFFTKIDGSYRIIKSIRNLCVFATHNIFKDPPFSKLDFISCCNLLIYLDNILQKKAVATFHYALNNNGYLMLGKSETIGASGQLFAQLEKKYKIYSKRKDAAAKAIFEMTQRISHGERAETSAQGVSSKNTGSVPELEKLIDNILLNNYIPACLVVNSELEILQFRGSTSLYLEPASGKASFNLMKMARPDLAFELRTAIHRVTKTGEPINKTGIQVKNKANAHVVNIEVLPIKSDTEEKLFLVVFEEVKGPPHADVKIPSSRDKYVKQLQDELASVRKDMRAIIEDQEASNEELQSANEEIVSSNEELQTINEELETSKEEVESTNEELSTINSELQLRNEQLAEANEYSEAVFSTIREALIMLDENLRIRFANKAFYKMFRVKESDTEGKRIYDLGNGQWNIDVLKDMLHDINKSDSQFEDFRVRHNFPLIGEKVMSLNARRIVQRTSKMHNILLAIEDDTEHYKAEKLMEEREKLFRNIANAAPVMIWIADANKSATFFNKTWLEYTGRSPEQENGNGWMENVFKDDLGNLLHVFQVGFDEQKSFDVEFRARNSKGEYRWVKMIGKPTYDLEGQFTGYVNTLNDIQDQKLSMEQLDKLVSQRTRALEESNKELERSNNELQQYAYVASHDLQEPLRKIIIFSDRLNNFKEEVPEKAKGYIKKISDSSERMAKLIDDLLNFSSTNNTDKKFIKTDLKTVIKDVLVDFDLIINQKKATVIYDGLPQLEAIPVQMEQLFHNLISNSLKFSKENSEPVITISSNKVSADELKKNGRLDQSKSYFKIVFKDNGIGFSEEFADQIFVIFQRLEEQKDVPGTGIGLALCRKIVDNHGGIISADSKKGEGAEFTIILPERQQ